MRNGFEAITIKISTEHKRELQRRALEHPQYGRWKGPKSYADLVREAIERYLAEPGEAKQQAAIAKQIAGKPAQPLGGVTFVVHYASAGNRELGRSACNLRGLQREDITTIASNATCTGCRRILDGNARALAAPSKARTSASAKRSKTAPAKKARRK